MKDEEVVGNYGGEDGGGGNKVHMMTMGIFFGDIPCDRKGGDQGRLQIHCICIALCRFEDIDAKGDVESIK